MIEKKINNLKDRLMDVRMSADDKRDVFRRISLVVEKIEAVSSQFHKAPVLSPFNNIFGDSLFSRRFASNIFVYVRQRKFVTSLVVVLLLCATGGVSAVAENSLPGDSLYSMKLNINEQVKGFVAVTPEAKARLAVETTERRLQEAVILSSQGKLTDERKQIIQGQLSKNATDVKNSVATLVATNNISVAQEVSTNFEASLKTHELMLATLEGDVGGEEAATSTAVVADRNSTSTEETTTLSDINTGTSTNASSVIKSQPINTLMQDIRQEINYNAQIREQLSLKEIAEATDPAKISSKITEVKTKYADLLYQRKTLTDLSSASIKLFDSYLNTASSTINDAETALASKDLVKAVTSLQQALKAMSDSDSLISIELNSSPEVRKALELIDINKLMESIHSDDSKSDSNSTSTLVSALTLIGTLNGTSTGIVLGTSTPSIK